MATDPSRAPTRIERRRAAVREEALDYALALMGEDGVGALTVTEVARRMGIRGPSCARRSSTRRSPSCCTGARSRASSPPPPSSSRRSRRWPTCGRSSPRPCAWASWHRPPDSDDAIRLWTVVLSGLISQQLANQPGVSFADGAFSRLTDTAIDQFLGTFRPAFSPCGVAVQTLDRDEVSTVVAAPPEVVYGLVADVTRTPEFSPEITSCRWLDGATGPAVGARFEAVDTNARGKSWKNRPVVTVAEPAGRSPSPAPNRSPGRSPGATDSNRSTVARAWSRATRWSGRSAESATGER